MTIIKNKIKKELINTYNSNEKCICNSQERQRKAGAS